MLKYSSPILSFLRSFNIAKELIRYHVVIARWNVLVFPGGWYSKLVNLGFSFIQRIQYAHLILLAGENVVQLGFSMDLLAYARLKDDYSHETNTGWCCVTLTRGLRD
jgi:hypothetical protein